MHCPSNLSNSHAVNCPTNLSNSHAVNCPTNISNSHAVNCPTNLSNSHIVNCPTNLSNSHAVNCPSNLSNSHAVNCPTNLGDLANFSDTVDFPSNPLHCTLLFKSQSCKPPLKSLLYCTDYGNKMPSMSQSHFTNKSDYDLHMPFSNHWVSVHIQQRFVGESVVILSIWHLFS